MSENKINSQIKDRLFKKVFENKEDLLSLYNAINETNHTNAEDVEINTIENFIYMGMKNDVSCLIANVLNLYEQQSTINPNMPLRGFLYIAELYRKMFGNHTDLYSSAQIKLPLPQFIIFYNGTDREEDRREMRLSDAYVGDGQKTFAIECTATLININYGHNRELMQKCERLEGYSILVYRIRQNISEGMQKEEAVDKAVEDCIKDGILTDILEKHRAEATTMILEEYNEDLHIKNEKDISFNDGFKKGEEKGMEKGMEKGVEKGRLDSMKRMLNNGYSEDEVVRVFDASGDEIEQAKRLLKATDEEIKLAKGAVEN